MKRILLTTTSLVLAAGVAQADVSFSGTAGVALIDDNGASAYVAPVTGVVGTTTVAAVAPVAEVARSTRDDMFFESYYDFDITASAESDNGISVSVGFDMGGGNKIDYNDDDKLEAQGAAVGHADVTIGYNGWTIAVDNNGIADLYDGDIENADASISGTIAGWAVAATTDQDASKSSYSVSGAVAGITLTATGSNDASVHAAGNGTGSASKIAASYAMGDLTLSASVANEAGTSEDDSTIGLSYAMGDLTVGYTTIKPGLTYANATGTYGDEWDFSVAYAAGAVSASFATDETEATTIIVDYDLGGGASAFAAFHDKTDKKQAAGHATNNDLTAIGLNFAF
ncbi:porin [Planktomarina sp.]|uniref:porin n=1 Tax=Planktomarina sp. TaxID=2024851 RepID=UPI0032602AD6